jgi:large subunit ribosomal protein L3
MKSIIGKKVGMTSIFDTNGKQTAVTIIEAGPCVVTQKKTTETDGYNALQIAFGDKKEKHTLLAEKNHFGKANSTAKKYVKEIRDSESDKNVGDTITVEIFAEGDNVAVVGTRQAESSRFYWWFFLSFKSI